MIGVNLHEITLFVQQKNGTNFKCLSFKTLSINDNKQKEVKVIDWFIECILFNCPKFKFFFSILMFEMSNIISFSSRIEYWLYLKKTNLR